MRRAIIAALVAFTFVATAGMAMAGESIILIDTWVSYGGIDEDVIIAPGYLSGELFYQSTFDVPFGKNVATTAAVAVPTGVEDDVDTVFFQHAEADEIYGPPWMPATFTDVMIVTSVGGPNDDLYHELQVAAWGDGDPYGVIPTVSRDIDITTGWTTDADEGFAMSQEVHSDTIREGAPDAFAVMHTVNMYGDLGSGFDYYFEVSQWGFGLDFELDWGVGTGIP